MKKFIIMGIYWKFQSLGEGGGPEKPIYEGGGIV